MGKRKTYEVIGPEIDLEKEVVRDSQGRRVDKAYVEQALAEVEADLAKRSGRPSLTGAAKPSPQATFRITPDLKARAEKAAKAQGTTVSQLAREAFERFLAS